MMIDREYAIHRFHDTDIYLKTGAYGQGCAFSVKHCLAAAWHRTAYDVKPISDRNDTLLSVLDTLEHEFFQ